MIEDIFDGNELKLQEKNCTRRLNCKEQKFHEDTFARSFNAKNKVKI